MTLKLILFLALLAVVNMKTLSHLQTTNLECCPKGMIFDRRLLTCVCPPGTSPTGPSKICCPPGTIATPNETCGCAPPKHLNPSTKQC